MRTAALTRLAPRPSVIACPPPTPPRAPASPSGSTPSSSSPGSPPYQVAWQRALFTIVGINVESVTLVVTAFMAGLGAGGLAGGALSRDPRRPALAWFGAAELGVGLFGIASLRVFAALVGAVATLPSPGVAALTFAVLLAPTLLMGATLPLLAAHAVRATGNVGRSVGALYCVNTLGSAAASVLAATVLLAGLGLQGSVTLAAALNLAVGGATLLLWKGSR
jgi:predicted membrane-bound spermidine synthase